jgi:hypothetical protein
MQQTIMEMRAVAPNTLFRQRGIGGTAHSPLPGYGDYNTPEEVFPAAGEPGSCSHRRSGHYVTVPMQTRSINDLTADGQATGR